MTHKSMESWHPFGYVSVTQAYAFPTRMYTSSHIMSIPTLEKWHFSSICEDWMDTHHGNWAHLWWEWRTNAFLSNVELQDFRGQILRVSKVHDLYTAPSKSIRTQIFPADGTLNSKEFYFGLWNHSRFLPIPYWSKLMLTPGNSYPEVQVPIERGLKEKICQQQKRYVEKWDK